MFLGVIVHGGKLSRKNAKILGIIMLVVFTLTAILCVIFVQQTENEYNDKYHKGEFVCSVCGSHDTEGYHTFWTNDGMPCKAEELADYTIISCKHCGHTWRHYL